MMKFLILLLIVLVAHSYLAITTKAQQCKPSGGLRGKAPPGECNTENDSECCTRGQIYPTFECSPPFTNGKAKARLTLNSFQAGGDGGGASKCDGKFHSDSTPVVALSSGWLQEDGADRCNKNIRITAPSGKSVVARVVDECDSTAGCDDEHSFQPPCANNIVDGSRAVWDALGIPRDQQGDLNVIWSDA